MRRDLGYQDSVFSPPMSRATLGKFYVAREVVRRRMSATFDAIAAANPSHPQLKKRRLDQLAWRGEVLGHQVSTGAGYRAA